MYNSTRRRVKNAALAVFASCSLLGFNAAAQQKGADNTVLSIERNSMDNTPSSISFSPSAGWKAGQAQEIFKRYLGMDGTNTTMQLKYSTTTKSNVTAERYTMFYKGIKVEYGTYALTIKNGQVLFATGNYYNTDLDIPATPAITEGVAFGYALDFVHAEKYMWQDPQSEQFIKARYHKADTSYLPHGNLEWIEDYSTGEGDRHLHLAYSFDIFAQKPTSRQLVFVDAQTGKILHSNSIIKHTAATGHSLYSQAVPIRTAHTGATYVLYDSTRGNGVYTVNAQNGTSTTSYVDFSSATNTWPPTSNDSQAVDAQWGAEMVYDYWSTQQGRLSYDNANGQLVQYVHWDNGLDNAFWDGYEMCYGDGTGCAAGGFTPLTSLDVTGHEIGHGVCQYTANLTYSGESGAMNEGFSDCWGATIENWANPHEVDAVAKQPWKIGEEIGCGNPLRSMDNPALQQQPSVYNYGPYWVTVTGCTPSSGNDECGVHTNSGILNHWYYLVTMGGSGVNAAGTAYNVNAIGWTEAPNILYQTELVLASNATYAMCRTTTINTATALYGACSPEVQSVTNAWYAVGVGAAFVPCTPQMGFTRTLLDTTEYTATTSCPASKVINIGVKSTGPAISGGSAIVTIGVGHGTAVAGVDYALSGTTMTFPAGDTSTHYATLTIYDNGAVHDDKNLVLGFSLNAGTSNAVISPVSDSMTINIHNNDSIPNLGGTEYHTLNTGTLVTSNQTSAFRDISKRGRSQFLLYASELTAAGVRPNVPISQIAFNITTKTSTGPYVGYTLSMANTTATDLSTAFVTGLSTVYTGSPSTNLGLDSLDFTANFTWDGTSNVVVQACFGADAANFTASDNMDGIQQPSAIVCDYVGTNTGTGAGCALTYSTGGQSTTRPVMRFKQVVPPAAIETALASTRTWNIQPATEVYFYNPTDAYLIAGVKNESNSLGCTSATITAAGTGMTPTVFSSLNRSVKEVTVTPTTNGATTTYDGTIYLTNTELNGVSPSTLYLLNTTAVTDAAVNAGNTVIVTPTLLTGTNYVGFQGHFTGFGRMFLVDGPVLCTPPAATITAGGPTTFCLGGNVTLTANSGTGYTYQWQKDGTAIAGATNMTYSATLGGAYTVVITQMACNGTSGATVVTLDSASVAAVGGATTVCAGQTATLTDVTTGGVWHSADSTIASVNTAGVVTGVAAGSVLISYTKTNGCGSATQTASVTVNAAPVVAAVSGAGSMCAGTTSSFTDATGAGTWTTGNGSVATVDASGNVSAAGAGTTNVIYTVTNGAGCTTASTASLTVLAQPAASITASGSLLFCTGGSVTLNANTGTGLSYQWLSGGTAIAGATTASYTASTTGNYAVVVTNTSNCAATSATDTAIESGSFVVVPSVAISAVPGLLVCIGSGPVTYTAAPTNGGTAPAYSWSVNGSVVAGGSSLTYAPANGDVISCVMTSNAACVLPDTASNSVTMDVSNFVMPSVSISTPFGDTACTSTPMTFYAAPVNGGTTPAYVWTKNGVNVATGATYTYVPSSGDVIYCTMSSSYPCLSQDTAVSSSLTMVIASPTVNSVSVSASSSTIVSGTPVTFTATAPHAGTSPVYQWFINGAVVPGATSSTYTTDTLANGQIVTCEVTSSEPCATPHINMSSGVSVLVTTGVKETIHANSFVLIPNPNKGTFIVKGYANTDNLTIRITDVLGQVIYTRTVQVNNNYVNEEVTLSDVANGMYLVSITSAAGSMVYHVVIDK